MKERQLKRLSTVLIVLSMTIATLMMGITDIKAQASTIKSYVYLAVNPNPVGVGQAVQVTTWIAPYPTSYADDAFHNVTVTITKPDGARETKGPFNLLVRENSQYWFIYTPTTVGNYTFKASYPGETRPAGQFSSAESPTTTLAVQQEPIQGYQDNPLPTTYWDRPINAQNRLWASISGDWLMTAYNLTYTTAAGVSVGALNPVSQAPMGPHVMWTKEITTGGLVAGEQTSSFYWSGPSYSSQFSPPIVMAGNIYYSTPTDTVCVDLRTGQELWRNTNITSITCGQNYFAQKYSYTNAGSLSLLWTRSWQIYDAFDGRLRYNYINYPTTLSRPIFADDGSMLVHVIGRGWLAMWNSSRAGFGTDRDWSRGLQWNVTVDDLRIPTSLYPILGITSSRAPSILSAWDNVLIGSVRLGSPGYNVIYDMGYDLTTGRQLWVRNYTQEVISLEGPTYWHAIGDGVHAEFIPAIRSWRGYDVYTGKLLWTSDPQDYPWGLHESYYPTIAYGKLYSLSYDGNIYAFDVRTGKKVWSFSAGNSGLETSSGTYPFFYGPIIADGVIFASNGYETPYPPLPRGAKVFAVNASTGEEIWDMNGMLYLRAIADGYLLGVNVYDSQLYCIGKGPSKTTVTAPQVGVTTATPVTISGTITDISAGSKQNAVAANFPNGLPCVSDASQGAWMSHVYQQQSMPKDVTGVPISISVLDANTNYRTIGTTVSDPSGTFAFNWTPDIPGAYTVYATFEGSGSYYPSNAIAYFYASEPAAPEPAPEYPPPIDNTMVIVAGAIAVIIVVAIVGVVIVLMLRKRS